MTTADKIKYGLVLAGLVGIMILGFSIVNAFKRSDSNRSELVRQLIESKDREIKAITGQREILEQWKAENNSLIAEHKRNDSLLLLQQAKTKIIYERVPFTVRNYGHEELRRAVNEFYEANH